MMPFHMLQWTNESMADIALEITLILKGASWLQEMTNEVNDIVMADTRLGRGR